MPKFNPSMLVVAREARGLTQAELSERLGTTQATVSKYEAELLNVSDDDAAKMARELDFPVEFFFQTDTVYGFGSPCFYHRKRTRMPVSELRQLQARLNIFRFHVTRLMRSVEIETTNRFVRLDVEDHGGPEEVARLVRHQWEVPMGPIGNVVNAVESAGAIVFSLPMGTRSIDAISQIAPGCPPVIFVNSDIPGDRLRFTLMHEIGHVIMHQVPSENMEQQADRFAAEFLMPEREIKPSLHHLKLTVLAGLKTQWKVSMASLVKRAHDLECLTERQYRYLMTQLSSQGWRRHEPLPIPVEQPTVFSNILNVYQSQLGFTTAEMARTVNATESRFSGYFKEEIPGGLRVVG